MLSRCIWLGVLGVLACVAGCPPPEPPPVPIPPVSGGKVRVRVFTDPSPVSGIVAVGGEIFVGTEAGLERWDPTGKVEVLTASDGLPGDDVVALAADPAQRRVWVLTDGGLGAYDLSKHAFASLVPPPEALAIDFAALAKAGGLTLVAAGEGGGVWLGSPGGLAFISDQGGWVPFPIQEPVRALVRDGAGWLWIATKSGLWARRPSGDLMRIGASQGCEVTAPRLLVAAPGDRVMAIGTGEQGHERIAIGRALTWTSFRTLPELAWDAAVSRGGSVDVMGGGRIYRLAPADAGTVRPLARDGMRLVPQTGGESAWAIDPVDLVLPPDPTALGAAGGELLIGTRDRGTARYRAGDAHPRAWLRRRDMFADATALSVACTGPTDCWIATGAHQAWHWNGERFAPGGPDEVVLAVARDAAGAIYALHRGAAEHVIHLSRLDGADWTLLPQIELTTPGDAPAVSFARFAASGALWVGLRYLDGLERRPYGIAIVDPAAGKVAYHRTEATPDPKAHMLPIPVDVADAALHGDTAWFATSEGIARLAGGHVTLWTEADGLRSELARAVTVAPELGVVVASGAGAEVWNGKAWTFPLALRFEINDVVATRSGQVWMATERGIAAWDGNKVRRVDTRRGLAENEMLDVAVDRFDRVWARGPSSLTLISQ